MKFRSKVKKLVITTGMLLMLGLGMATTAYAAEPGTQTTQQQQVAQSDRWEGTGDTWKVRTQDNTGYLSNSWFQDNDGSWYLLGSDGTMSSGIILDESTGKYYLLNTEHDGTYGKMLTQDGAHNVNGVTVYLTFDQNHSGSYGAILTGLSEARSTGAKVTQLPSIPSDSTSGSTQPTNTPQTQPNQQNNKKSKFGGSSTVVDENFEIHDSGVNWLQG